jgi:hypothetical protein
LAVFGDDHVDVVPGCTHRAAEIVDERGAPTMHRRDGDDAQPPDGARTRDRVVGVTPDAADRSSRRPLDVDLPLVIDLDRRVDSDERCARREPADVMCVFDRVQEWSARGPVEQAGTTGQVRRDGIVEQEPTAIEIHHTIRQQTGIDPDGHPERFEDSDTERSRSDLQTRPGRHERHDALGDRAVLVGRPREAQRYRQVIGLPHDDHLVGGHRRSGVAARHPVGDHPGDASARGDGGPHPRDLGAERVSATGTRYDRGQQELRP